MDKSNLIDQTKERYPFLTGIKYANNEYVGVVVNHDNSILTFYDIDKIPDVETKKVFLELGEIWWWESNRQLPIDVFLHHEMKPFHSFLSTFIALIFRRGGFSRKTVDQPKDRSKWVNSCSLFW